MWWKQKPVTEYCYFYYSIVTFYFTIKVRQHVSQFNITFSRNLLMVYYYFDKLSCKKLGYLTRHFYKILEYAIFYIIFLKIHLICWYKDKYIYSIAKFIILELYLRRAGALNSRPLKPIRFWQWAATVLTTRPSRHIPIPSKFWSFLK